MKGEIVHCRNAWDSLAHMHKALSNSTLAYWTATRWLQAFRSGRISTTDMHNDRISTADIHHGRCYVSIHIDMWVVMIQQCMDEDRLSIRIFLHVHRSKPYDRTSRCTRLPSSEYHIIWMWCNRGMHYKTMWSNFTVREHHTKSNNCNLLKVSKGLQIGT